MSEQNSHRHFGKAYERLFIQQKVYDLGLYLWPVLGKMNKEQRFVIVQTLMQEFNSIKKLIFVANKKYTKKDTLRQLDTEIGAFKMDIQWANDLGYLKDPQFENISKCIVEVGQMVGGWLKSEREKSGTIDSEGNEYICSVCGAVITKRINDYSTAHFGRSLCYACQKKISKK